MDTTHFRMNTTRRDQGFTLLELMIVIAILAIIIGIAVPVFLSNSRKADHVVAVNNLMAGSRVVDETWYERLAGQPFPDSHEAYRDYSPPGDLAGTGAFQSNGWVPVDAHYMSLREPKIPWVDLRASGGSGSPTASADIGPYSQAGSYGFSMASIWKNGQLIASGPEISTDWGLLPGKIGLVENMYYWEGGWHENADTTYITLVTLERISQLAHFYTMNVGCTVAGGTFDWKGGAGTPGDAWADETSGDKPTADNNPPPGGDTTQPTQPTEPTQPTQPTQPTEPTQPTQPTEPTQPTQPTQPTEPTQPVVPPNEPPPGPNMAKSMNVTPSSQNVDANGMISVHIALESGYDPANLAPDMILCYGASPTDFSYSANGLDVKFRRQDIAYMPAGDNVLFVVTGKYRDGTSFQAWDYVKIIDNGN